MNNSRRRAPKSAWGMGAFLAITLGTTSVLFSTIAGSSPGDTAEYRALFTDATRLVPGDEVRIAGVMVGRVKDVALTSNHNALVKFTARRSLQIPTSTRARIRYRDLVGARYVSLSPVATSASAGVLRAGDTIPLTQTEPALDLTVLLDGFQPLFSVLKPEQVNQLASQLVKSVQGEGGTLASLLSNTAELTSAIAARDDVIGRVVHNLNAVLATAAHRAPDLERLVDQLGRLSSGLAADGQIIGEAISSINGLTISTAGLLERARPPLTRDVRSLRVAAEAFAKTRGDLQDLLDRLPIKLNAFTRAGSYGGYLNFFVCDLDITLTLPGMPSVTAPGLRNNEELCQS